jgi:hypothetical protein
VSTLVTILAAGEPAQPSAPSQYMASARVEIAFNAGQRTAATLRTWTDVTDYVELAEGITITWGRQDERSTADANQLTLTLDNSDGRFTFGKTSGPYGSGVKLDRPIRVILTPVDGTEAVYFLGFVNEWPTEWNGTDAYAKCTITASSRLSRLGMQATIRSLVETEILADDPIAYYTMGEPESATQANDSSGRNALPMKPRGSGAPVVFGSATGPATDGLTAVQISSGGEFLFGSSMAPTATSLTLETAFLVQTPPTGTAATLGVVAGLVADQAVSGFMIAMNISGALTVVDAALNVIVSATAGTYADNATHGAVVTISGTTYTLYVDGASAGTGTGPAISTSNTYSMYLGAYTDGSSPLAVTLAHTAVFNSALSSARVAAHWGAMTTGYAGETTSVRLIRYASYAGIPSSEVSAETGQATMVHIDTTDKQVVELMRICETTEGGVLHDGRDGTLMFHNRARRYVVSSSFTLNMAEQEVEADYLPKADRTGLANNVTVQNSANTVTAHRFDTTSQNDYGVATLSIETAGEDDDAPANQAGWNLYKYKDPKERVPSLTVDALAQVGKTPNCAAVLAATVGDKITVSNRPSQAATSSVDYFIEGGTIQIGPESLRVTWNLSPSSPEDQVLVIGDATRGVIGTNPVAF